MKEDPTKTTQPDFIHTLVTEHTAQLRERFLRDRASTPQDFDLKDEDDKDAKDDSHFTDKASSKKGKGKGKSKDEEEEDFATDYNFDGMHYYILFIVL